MERRDIFLICNHYQNTASNNRNDNHDDTIYTSENTEKLAFFGQTYACKIKWVTWHIKKRHAKTKASAVSEDTWKPPALDWNRVHWLWSYYYTRRAKEAIHIIPCLLQHKLGIEVEIPETRMLTTRNTKTE